MHRNLFLCLFVCAMMFVRYAECTETDQHDYETHEFTSKVFSNSRTLRVLLPEGYALPENADKRYPVLYMNDGYAVFHYWNLRETVRDLTDRGLIPPIIVVGIDNAGEQERASEYLPYPDETDPEPVIPKGKMYPEFLVGEILPFIEQTYRTSLDPDQKGFGGASYGAYSALYAIIQKPGVFGKLLLESTPLFISDFQILKDARAVRKWPSRISIGVGSKETDDDEINKEIRPNMEQLKSVILKGMPSANVRVYVQEGGRHNSKAWGSRLPAALEFLFGSPKP